MSIEDVLVQSGLGSLLVPFGARSTTVITAAAALEAARKGRREAITKTSGQDDNDQKKADKIAKNFIFYVHGLF